MSTEWIVVQDLLISVGLPGPVSDQIWQDFVKVARTAPVTKYLGCSVGKVEVSSVQRKQAAELFKSRNIRSAVVTDDAFVRGLVTAVSWLGANMNAFSWADLKGALRYLDVTGGQAAHAMEAVTKLRSKLEASRRGKSA